MDKATPASSAPNCGSWGHALCDTGWDLAVPSGLVSQYFSGQYAVGSMAFLYKYSCITALISLSG